MGIHGSCQIGTINFIRQGRCHSYGYRRGEPRNQSEVLLLGFIASGAPAQLDEARGLVPSLCRTRFWFWNRVVEFCLEVETLLPISHNFTILLIIQGLSKAFKIQNAAVKLFGLRWQQLFVVPRGRELRKQQCNDQPSNHRTIQSTAGHFMIIKILSNWDHPKTRWLDQL